MARRDWEPADAPGSDIVRLRSISLHDSGGEVRALYDIRDSVTVRIEYECLKGGHELLPAFSVSNKESQILFSSIDTEPEWVGKERGPGRYVAEVTIPGNFFAEGTLLVNTAMRQWKPEEKVEFYAHDVASFQIIDNAEGESARGQYSGDLTGLVRPKLDWHTVRTGDVDGS